MKKDDLAKENLCTNFFAKESAANFTRNLIAILSINGKKINKKDMDYVYKNILYAEL